MENNQHRVQLGCGLLTSNARKNHMICLTVNAERSEIEKNRGECYLRKTVEFVLREGVLEREAGIGGNGDKYNCSGL